MDATVGVDGAAGDIDSPWKTIAYINAQTFSPGCNIYFKRGETWAETLTIPSSGTNGDPITFGAYGNGPSPIIDGESTRTRCVDFNEKNYVVVEKLKLIGATDENVWLEGISTIQYCIITGGDAVGITLRDANSKVYNCVIYGNGTFGVNVDAAAVVTNCIIYGNTTNDFDFETATVTYCIVQDAHTGTGNTTTDPLFVSAAGGDFHVLPSSTAINTGTSLSLTTDCEGNAIFGTPDRGAYEYPSLAGGMGRMGDNIPTISSM